MLVNVLHEFLRVAIIRYRTVDRSLYKIGILIRFVDDAEIKPLIREAVHKHCEDRRIEYVIIDVLREVLHNQYFQRLDWDKHFKKHYKESILSNFSVEPNNE